MHAVGAPITHNTAETQVVEAAGVEFAYRRFGRPADLPLVMLQHFRGNLDNWDPALTDALAGESPARRTRRSRNPSRSTRASPSAEMNDIAAAARGESKPENLLYIGSGSTRTPAHGFLFQYPAKVAADVSAFLAREEGSVES